MNQRPGPVILWVQKWEESERGWGTRPDGYTLHRHRDDIEKFFQAMRAREAANDPNYVPDIYSRPCGSPYETFCEDDDLLARVKMSPYGIWGPSRPGGNEYPPALETGSDRTGWVTCSLTT